MKEKLFPTQEMGSLAKPRWLVAGLKEGKVTEKEVVEAESWGKTLGVADLGNLLHLLKRTDLDKRKRELREWASIFGIRFLEKAGLDIVYDGEMRRVEMYEYPVKRIKGFKFLGLVRSFDNKYYRKAACIDKVDLEVPYHLEEYEFVRKNTTKEVKVPITGPYTLADWSFNEYYTRRLQDRIQDPRRRRVETKRDFVLDLAKSVIRPNIKALVEAGARYVQIDEPAATTHPDEVDVFVEGFNEATSGIHCKLSVHICYSDYSTLYPAVLEMKNCSQFAWEFANRENRHGDGYGYLSLLAEYDDGREIGLGVTDVHVDSIEKPELVKDRILRAVKTLENPGRIYVNPDCGLRTRSWDVAFQKLKNMVEGAELARLELS